MPTSDSESPPARVLLIEDEPDIATLVSCKLRLENMDVATEKNGLSGLSRAEREDFDLVILDLMLPGLDGLQVCRRLRQTSDVPILMLTALGQVEQRIEGLNAGANDYLTKPFHLGELLARVQAHLRSKKPMARKVLTLADLVLDIESHSVSRAGQPIELTPKEFDLLELLMRNHHQVVKRERLLEAVWGHDFAGSDNVLEVTVRRLRAKVDGALTPLIHTVRGIGYTIRT